MWVVNAPKAIIWGLATDEIDDFVVNSLLWPNTSFSRFTGG
jgi:hypothetical protein